MPAFHASHPSEKKAALTTRLGEEGYLFFPSVLSPLAILGEFGSVRMQGGRLYYVVRAGETLQPEDGAGLKPHTDDFNDEGLPPRLVALHCIRPDARGCGQTLLADGHAWLSKLGPEEEASLRVERAYRKGEGIVRKPFLSGDGILRVSFGHLQFRDDPAMVKIMAGLETWFDRSAMSVTYRTGSLLLWDNWRMIHGRTAYEDLRRELHRYHLE
jgi:hypothetical protein